MSSAAQSPEAAAHSEARLFALICYGLYFAAILFFVTGIVGVVIAYIKRPEVRSTIWETHFTNLTHVFWVGMAMTVLWVIALTFGAWGIWSGIQWNVPPYGIGALPIAYLVSLLFLVWYLYRTIRGFLRAIEYRPYAP
jgi:uncharacterized membrane protein